VAEEACFNPSLEIPGFLVFCFWWFLNVSLAACGWAAACCPYFARAAYGHLQAVGWLKAPLGVHARLGAGLRSASHDVLYAGYPLHIVDTAEERNG